MTLGGSNSDSVSGDQLRAFFERIERLDEEIKALNDDKKEVFAEAKGNGFDTKAMKIVLKERRQDASERAELEALVELYRAAVGMASYRYDDEDETGTPDATRAPAQAKSEPATSEPSGVAADQGEGTAPGSLATNSQAKTSTGNGGSNAPLDSAPATGEASRLSDGSGTVASISEPDAPKPLPAATEEVAVTEPAQQPAEAKSSEQEPSEPEGSGGMQDRCESIPPSIPVPTAADNARKLRPYCQHADDLRQCAGQGHKHCFACLKAHADEEGIAA